MLVFCSVFPKAKISYVCVCVHAYVHANACMCVACQVPQSTEFSRQKILEWTAISFSKRSFQHRDQIHIPCEIAEAEEPMLWPPDEKN